MSENELYLSKMLYEKNQVIVQLLTKLNELDAKCKELEKQLENKE